jgi:hypothetical protein
MPNQFNFFQHPSVYATHWKTGSGVNTGWFVLNPLATGWYVGDGVNPWEYYGPVNHLINPISNLFYDIYRLSGTVLGRQENFKIPLAFDDIIYPFHYYVKMTGAARGGDNSYATISWEYSGNVFGTFRPSGNIDYTYSGELSGQMWDTSIFSGYYSGEYKSGNNDVIGFSGEWSGALTGSHNDIPFYCTPVYSGEVTGALTDIGTFYPTMSGSVWGKDGDKAAIDFWFSGIHFRVGGHRLSGFYADTGSINLTMYTISYLIPGA